MASTTSVATWRTASDRARLTTLALAVLGVGLFGVSFLLGPADLAPGTLFAGLMSGEGPAGVIAREIRLPRAALALVVGAALGASGAALQGLFRNPLAEPGVTGVTSSAGLGAVLALYFGLAASSAFLLPAFAIGGALASALILFVLSRSGAGAMALVLAGVAIASLAEPLCHERNGVVDDGIPQGS
jgi:iron complex transport system permease protein